MSLALSSSGRLRPDIRLAQAVSEFEADLTGEQKAIFRTQRSQAREHPPEPSDVMRLTARIDSAASRPRNAIQARCVGPRLTNVLQAIQQYVGLGDVVIGGSQNLIACGVWALVRTSLMLIINHSAYLEKLSILFMNAGRSAPRYEQLALLYPRSKALQAHFCEYLIVIVKICHKILRFSKKSYVGQLTSAMSDDDIRQYQTELELWATAVKEEATQLMNQTVEDEAVKNSRFRAISTKFSETAAQRKMVKERLRILNACSTYDYQTPWKQIRKIGNTSLLMDTPQYKKWRESGTSNTIICTGKLGSGKSVLLANVVDDLNLYAEQDRYPVAYFFCRHDIPETLRSRTILGSLVRQLLSTIQDLTTISDSDFEAFNGEFGEDYLLEYFSNTFNPKSRCYLVLDGLDECAELDRQILLSQCRSMQERLQFHVCVSYRSEADTRLSRSLEQLADRIVFSIPEQNPEIEGFIEAELQALILEEKLNIGDPALIIEIRDALLQGAQGMFLWVALQISSLCAENTDEKIRNALENLPKDLSATFTHILKKAAAPDRDCRRLIFQLIVVAQRPLTVEELREALSVVPGDTEWNPSRLINNIYSTLACCGSLVVIDEEEETIRLVHHSVKQYLTSNSNDEVISNFELQASNRRMGRILLTYLSYNIFQTQISTRVIPVIHTGSAPRTIINSIESLKRSRKVALKLLSSRSSADSAQSDPDIGQFVASQSKQFSEPVTRNAFALHAYAKANWLFHTSSILDDDIFSQEALLRLLEENTSDSRSLPWHQEVPYTNPRYAFGRRNSRCRISPPVRWAIKNSHLPLLRYHIRIKATLKTIAGIFIELKRSTFSFTLQQWPENMCTQLLPFATLLKSTQTISWLLVCGASISYRNYCVIAAAISRCNLNVLQMLLHGVNKRLILNSLDIDPIYVASFRGDADMVSYLLSKGAEIKHTGYTHSPLYLILSRSMSNAHLKAARDLLNAGAEFECPVTPRTAIDVLILLQEKHEWEMVPKLIQTLSRVQLDRILLDCCGGSHKQTLFARYNIREIARTVMKFGASVRACDELGRDCLTLAVEGAGEVNCAMAEILLEARAYQPTHLHLAKALVLSGDRSIIRLLLLHGVERDEIRRIIRQLEPLQQRIIDGDSNGIEFLPVLGDLDRRLAKRYAKPGLNVSAVDLRN